MALSVRRSCVPARIAAYGDVDLNKYLEIIFEQEFRGKIYLKECNARLAIARFAKAFALQRQLQAHRGPIVALEIRNTQFHLYIIHHLT